MATKNICNTTLAVSSNAITYSMQPMFYALANYEVNAIGSGGHFVGTIAAMTEISDQTGSFFPGDGAGTEASFTVPNTGKYLFTYDIWISADYGDQCDSELHVNGTSVYATSWLPANPRYSCANTLCLRGAYIKSLTVGDIVTLRVAEDDAGSNRDPVAIYNAGTWSCWKVA